MIENLVSALEITLIGMGLVFAAIILLWAVMALLVRFGTMLKTSPAAPSPKQEASEAAAAKSNELKLRAAAVAVAYALEQNKTMSRKFPLPPTAFVSAWQAVARSNVLKRGRVR